MRSITAGVSLGMNSAARRFSSTCETREAPVITVETFGLRAHHAIASCASVQPSSFATASSLPTVSFFALSVRSSKRNFMRGMAPRLSAGTPARLLAGEQARGERAPGREPQADLVVEARVFALDAVAVEEVVLGLLHHGLAQVVLVRDLPRRHDLGHAPFGSAPVERLAALDHIVHRPPRFYY